MPLSTGIGLSLANIPLIGGEGFVGLLDAYTSDLQVAVLPFRGFSSYTGPWCRIRESGGDTEQDIGYDSDGQPDTAEWQAFVGANNGFIRTWYDQSGASRDMVQATASSQHQSVLNTVNGYPVSRALDATAQLSTSITANIARTLYAVMVKRSAQTGAAIRPSVLLENTNNAFFADNAGSPALNGGWGWRATNISTQLAVGGTVTDWTLCTTVAIDAASGNIYVNNSPTAFDPNGSMATATNLHIGQNPGTADVDFAAVLLYNTAHDDTTRQAIQTILATQFGITLA